MTDRLTKEKIVELSKRPNVRAIAVQNFLGTLGGMSKSDAIGNLDLDAGLYKWNDETYDAIMDGILLRYGEGTI